LESAVSYSLDPHDRTAASSRLSQLTLTEFRNYRSLHLELEASKSVILTGKNGVGKTNLLEAISLMAPGRGLRQAKLAQLQYQPVSKSGIGWGVAATVRQQDGSQLQFGTGQLPERQDKRVIRIDGEPLKAQTQLPHYVSLLWQTPQMDGLFTQSSSEKRHYFDRICGQFHPEHSAMIHKYDYLRRERAKLLAFSHPDAQWLSSLEQKMAEASLAIAGNRLDAMLSLQQALEQLHPAFPKAEITLEGMAERALIENKLPAVEIEQQLIDRLAQSRAEDAASGRCSHGAHKLELVVIFSPKQVEASYCSTGEQKALMLSLLLAQAEAMRSPQNKLPLILLDEVVAHLDENRRFALFETLTELGCQCWMTGTDRELFEGFESVDHYKVDNQTVTRQS
jgi:DNA replication and repair protein RecF